MEREQTVEEKVLELKGNIVQKMIENGADPTSSIQQMGVGVVRVVSDTDMDGWNSLILHSNGEWSLKWAMNSFPIGRGPEIEAILKEYAYISQPESRAHLSVEHGATPESKAEYLRQNKDKLLEELAAALENTLQSLS